MTDQISDDTIVCRDPDTLWRHVLDGLLVIAPQMEEPIEISMPGDVVWQLLDEPMAIGDLVHTLAMRFGEATSAIQPDVNDLLHALLAAGAIRVVR